jgi:Tfp pilus assembly protein PilF
VESVVWLTERKDVLSTFFLFLTLLLYTRYVKSPGPFHYFAALVAFGLGLSAKGMLVTLPLLMLFLDYWPYERLLLNASHQNRIRLRKLFLEKVPFFGLSATIAVLTVMAQQGAITGLKGHSLSERLANSAVSVVRYLFGYFVPTTYSISYSFPKDGWGVERVVFSGLLILAITVIVLKIRRSKPAALVGWLWFTVSLLPVIGLVQVGAQAMADRYMYVPSIGLSIMVGWLVPDRWLVWQKETTHPEVVSERSRIWFTTGFVVVVGLLALQTDQVVSKWSDSITLFSHAVKVEPNNNYLAHRALGAAYFDAGKLDVSADQYRQALQCIPERKDAVIGSVNLWLSEGDVSRAGVYTKAALQLDENDGDLWFLMGNVMRKQGRTGDAEHCYRKAISLKPQFSEALHNLGLLLCSTNNAEGIQCYHQSLEVDPTNAVAWNSLGNALVRAGELQSAEQSYLQAIRLADLEESKKNLAYVRELSRQISPPN